MKGLILKDIMNLKKQGKIYVLVIGIYIIFAIMNESSVMLQYMICMFAAMLLITALAYDEKADWDKYALSMPVSRRQVVLSKYCVGLLGMAVGALLIVIYNLIIPSKVGESNNLVPYASLIGVLFLSLMLPILFKFGVEKGRVLMLLVLFLPMISLTMIAKSGIPEPSMRVIFMLKDFFPVIVIIVLAISILISQHIYQNKEL